MDSKVKQFFTRNIFTKAAGWQCRWTSAEVSACDLASIFIWSWLIQAATTAVVNDTHLSLVNCEEVVSDRKRKTRDCNPHTFILKGSIFTCCLMEFWRLYWVLWTDLKMLTQKVLFILFKILIVFCALTWLLTFNLVVYCFFYPWYLHITYSCWYLLF